MTPGERLHEGLERFFLLRQHSDDARFRQRLMRLQRYQAERLIETHADYLAQPQVAPAIRFLIDEVYGGRDLKPVATEIRRAVDKAEKLLPGRVLETSATVLEAAVLTQELDEALTECLACRLDHPLDDEAYCDGYRTLGRSELRHLQLAVIGELGHHIDRYVRSRMIQATFRLVRRPAHAAGFGNLYDFLDSGFTSTREVTSCGQLLEALVARERRIMERVFARHPRPFAEPLDTGVST